MAGPKQKMQKIQPLIKLRQLQLDQETMILSQIKLKKGVAEEELVRAQRLYIDGVEKLNGERQSPDRKLISALESGVDYAKSRWYQSLKALRIIEDEEKKQLDLLLEAQKKMKMLEHLDEKYLEQHLSQQKAIEQKQLDSFALEMARRKTSD